MDNSTENSPSRVPAFLKKALPVLVSVGILYYYFRDVEWADLVEKTARANLPLAILSIAVPQVIFWFFEALIAERHFRWFHGGFDWKSYFWARGAIYILQLINTGVSGGGVLLYLRRKTGITWSRLMGIMLFRFGLTMWGFDFLLIPSTLAAHYYGLAGDLVINIWVWWGILIFGLIWFIEAWIVWHHGKIYGIAKYLVGDRIESDFWTAFRLAGRSQWFYTWAMTMPPIVILMVGFYYAFQAFGIEVGFIRFMVVAPLLLAFMDLPIALAGFGTTTLGFELFFPDVANQEALLALSLFMPAARSASRAAIGIVSLPPAMRDISSIFRGETGVVGEEAGD